jgi:hypothetical protein
MITSFESTAARPSLSISRIVTAAGSRSATKRVSPSSLRGPAASYGVVRARRRIFCEWRAFEVQTFRPLTTQPAPSRRAVVRIRLVSLPASGSVTPNARLSLPVAMPGRIRSRSDSLPCLTMGIGGKTAKWTGEAPVSPAPDAQMASSIRTASTTPSPAPPYASGITIPSQPARANASRNSPGYSAFRSFSRQYSQSKLFARVETSLRISSWASVRAKSMASRPQPSIVAGLP